MSSPPGGRRWYKRWGYQVIRFSVWCLFVVCFRFRAVHNHRIPRTGGALLCPNHTSHLDPLIGGISTTRPMNFLAKKELFSVPFLRSLISFLDSIPIDRFGLSAGAIKEMLKRLKREEMVLMFPEGTRSLDGNMGVVKSGFATLARRIQVPVIPIGIEGSYRAWPRNRKFPMPGRRILVVVGEPISPEVYGQLSDDEFTDLLENRIKDCIRECRRRMKWAPERIEEGLNVRRLSDAPTSVDEIDAAAG
ncbi:MAG TPA: lysophospholipid acyltransferase family protein [Pirellulaceae bacterium]|nr:lysophospholipid acyltransferase family protein [Pirellulaceae bacterium]